MWLQKGNGVNGGKKGGAGGGGKGLVAIAINREKGSQNAIRWAAEHLLGRGQNVVLIHVVQRPSSAAASLIGEAIICNSDGDFSADTPRKQQLEMQTRDIFLTFHCYCTRKDIQCLDVILEDTDVVKALNEYVLYAAIDNLVLGVPTKHGFISRFKTSSVGGSVSKGAPDFCTVYVISKGKVSSVRNASRSAPSFSPLHEHLQKLSKPIVQGAITPRHKFLLRDRASFKPRTIHDELVKSPISHGGERISITKCSGGFFETESDISFISSGRPSMDRTSVAFDYSDSAPSRFSTSSESSFTSLPFQPKWTDLNNLNDFSSVSDESCRTPCSWSSQNLDEAELEMKRLKLELKQTMEMYSTACKEALTAKQKAMELNDWRREEQQKLEEARLAQEAAIAIAEQERARCRAAVEAADAAKRIAELESHKRANLEMKALKEAEEMQRALKNVTQSDIRYRLYSIEEVELATERFAPSRKIGEGGYGPVFRCRLDHTSVAVKVLRPDASQGRSQFQQEIDILSCIRHPNMVLLLGACPEYGILVYEYMSNGSLEDRLFRKGNTPVIPWQLRFRIAAEIATGLLFLHQTKPEPLVHRDLKPANILLDHSYVCKISDVGLARLLPAVAENVTQCCMTSAAGTFCYIDPEYQQTGMLGVKSDVYSLGIMLLQLITAKPPMGLAHQVARSIEKGTFQEFLDPAVTDWPVEQALCFAKLALQCAELRRKDRPDLCSVVLPELNNLREFGEKNMEHMVSWALSGSLSGFSNASMEQDIMSDPHLMMTSESSKGQSSASSQAGGD
ncbi:U-box domain-containing protein 35-like isoform X1 [Cucurbita moschata]|uniref:RING-type E3 ubiquitin transferase n=1 Tax=Cucurbita moschata TaxID=3662 RepID=A0A6J1GL51_CUCMO|nr:U-box domain-containing protein 35-like isoform X1 [Cucurbita moschata]XP_022952250.1 U-box domain-containing protein 35-like isoform X1 [Cucurbita moschata]XP_022952251.1 U-box domain-containing protein 35-like isoform X1 [Cucurbita moschata]XP_022952252.1 U-box domain-containing protein 35-like isoform X1 [Cucurbita moschata]